MQYNKDLAVILFPFFFHIFSDYAIRLLEDLLGEQSDDWIAGTGSSFSALFWWHVLEELIILSFTNDWLLSEVVISRTIYRLIPWTVDVFALYADRAVL